MANGKQGGRRDPLRRVRCDDWRRTSQDGASLMLGVGEADDFLRTMLVAVGLGFAVAIVAIAAALFPAPLERAVRRVLRTLTVRFSRRTDAASVNGRSDGGSGGSALQQLARGRARTQALIASVVLAIRRLAASRPPAREAGKAGTGTPAPPAWAPAPSAEPPAAPGEPQAPARDSLGRRFYLPASSLYVEEQVRAFLEARGGATSLDALVGHLDRVFGHSRGQTMVEALRARGLIALRRPAGSRSELQVHLLAGQSQGGDPG